MRHRNRKGRLSRNLSERKALFKNLAIALITYQRIETTKAKARFVRSFVEPLITMAKKSKDPVFARREAYRKLCDRAAVQILFKDLAPLYKDTPGGYTRIMPLGYRKGDGAEMAIIELTKRTIPDDELLGTLKKKEPSKKKNVSKKGESVAEGTEGSLKKKAHSAPEIDEKEKEEHVVEDVKKEKAKSEQKKITTQGFFKRFRRKSMG